MLSPSTEAYDRGEKLEHYKRIPSLATCLLVALDRREVEVWSRNAAGSWSRALITQGDVALDAIGARLDVLAAYDDAAEPKAP